MNGGIKPNRSVEEILHHSPVDGMIDEFLLSEIRRMPAFRGEDFARAERVALQISWRLHSLVSRRVDGV